MDRKSALERLVELRRAKRPKFYGSNFVIPQEWYELDKNQLAHAVYRHEGGKLNYQEAARVLKCDAALLNNIISA